MKRPILFTLTLLVGSWLIAAPGAQVQPQPTFQSPVPPIVGYPSSGINGSGTVTSAQILAPDGSASAPSYSFANDPNTGFYKTGDDVLRLAVGGAESFVWSTNALFMRRDTAQINFGASDDVSLSRGAANVLTLASGDMLSFGGVSSTDMMLKRNSTILEVKRADDSAYGALKGSSLLADTFGLGSSNVMYVNSTAPTVTSAGTSPSIATNGTVTGRINVGTGGSATTVVIAMPAATTGWNCQLENLTATAANRANQRVTQQSSTTTSFTAQNQTISTGAALAFTASDIVSYICFAY